MVYQDQDHVFVTTQFITPSQIAQIVIMDIMDQAVKKYVQADWAISVIIYFYCLGNTRGRCAYGKVGSGHCRCNTGFYGFSCEATEITTKCVPKCDRDFGSCNEGNKSHKSLETGKCHCYDGYTGSTCTVAPTPTPAPKNKTMSAGVIDIFI